MSDEFIFPTSYEQWRHCIEVRGKIRLTSNFIGERLAEMQNSQHPKTRDFIRLYGERHLQQTIDWFLRAANEQ